MNNQIRVRQLLASDVEAYQDIWLEGLKLDPQSFAATYQQWRKKSRSQWIEDLEFGLVFGGFIGDRLMGIVKLEIDCCNHSAYLSSLYVRQDVRGKGLAKAMVKYLLDYARTWVNQVHLRVVATNILARNFFQGLGFEICGVTSDGYLDGRSRLILAIALSVNQPQTTTSQGTSRNLAII